MAGLFRCTDYEKESVNRINGKWTIASSTIVLETNGYSYTSNFTTTITVDGNGSAYYSTNPSNATLPNTMNINGLQFRPINKAMTWTPNSRSEEKKYFYNGETIDKDSFIAKVMKCLMDNGTDESEARTFAESL